MDWKTLKEIIPEIATGAVHSNVVQLREAPDWSLRIKQPGKYGASDFVVELSDPATGWKYKKFRIDHLFEDVQLKTDFGQEFMATQFINDCAEIIVNGEDPIMVSHYPDMPGLNMTALHTALQTLALAEHRRYGYNERIGGGRYLPYRFCAGIATRHWSAADATLVFRTGMRGLVDLQARGGREPSLRLIAERIRNGV